MANKMLYGWDRLENAYLRTVRVKISKIFIMNTIKGLLMPYWADFAKIRTSRNYVALEKGRPPTKNCYKRAD